MRSQNKGFDPLSSLFEMPEPAGVDLLPEVDEEEPRGPIKHVDLTDPLFKSPPGLQAQDVEVRPTAFSPPAGMPLATGPRPDEVDELDPTTLPPAPEVRPAPAAPAEMSAEERARIARAVGQAAAQRARGSAPAPQVSPAPPPAATSPASPAPAAPVTQGSSRMSRLDGLVARSRRPVNAAEAARKAVAEEAAMAQERRPAAPERTLSDRIEALLSAVLPGVGPVYVANAMLADQRTVLKALWKSHRAKFIQDGQIERAVGASAALRSIQELPEGQLVAAHVVTDASDYLVWIDLQRQVLVAAFADARSYFAGQG